MQRVGYRAATVERASALELDGSVRNLADGRVEVVVAGEPDAVEALVAWLWNGPPAGAVRSVVREDGREGPRAGVRLARCVAGRKRGQRRNHLLVRRLITRSEYQRWPVLPL